MYFHEILEQEMYAKTPQMRTCKNRALTALVSGVLRVWFKHHVLHSSQWRKSIVRILKPTDVLMLGGHNGSCLMFFLEGGPIFKLSVSLACH